MSSPKRASSSRRPRTRDGADVDGSEAWDAKCRELFRHYDKDNSGFIDRTELRALLVDLRVRTAGDDGFAAYLEEEFKAADIDHDNRVTYEEFVGYHNKLLAWERRAEEKVERKRAAAERKSAEAKEEAALPPSARLARLRTSVADRAALKALKLTLAPDDATVTVFTQLYRLLNGRMSTPSWEQVKLMLTDRHFPTLLAHYHIHDAEPELVASVSSALAAVDGTSLPAGVARAAHSWLACFIAYYEHADGASAVEERERRASKLAESDDEDDADDGKFAADEEDAPAPRPRGRGRRQVIFAEPVKMDADWTPPVYDKSDADRQRIRDVIMKLTIFKHLDEEQTAVVVAAMFPKVFAPGDVIIRQGDEGDNFYVVDRGNCDIFVEGAKSDDNPTGLVLQVGDGGSFGELALLYDAPRAATVVAAERTETWAIERLTFKRILMGSTTKRRNLYAGFLDNVDILSTLDKKERLTIADALDYEDFEAGEEILEEGSPDTDNFFIIESGEVKITKEKPDGRAVEVCPRRKVGDYFGELALLHDEERAATVTAVTETRCLLLDRATFKRLLGPITDVLNRNAELYAKYEDAIAGADLSDDEEEDDELETPRGPVRDRRDVIFSEAVKVDDDWEPPVVPKEAAAEEEIRRILSSNQLFKHLEEEQTNVVVAAMFAKPFAAGDVIIRQGDEGDNFYVIASGTCDIFVEKAKTADNPSGRVLVVSDGDSFGELALMYDAPRAATVQAKTAVNTWAIDRLTFKRILMGTTAKRRNRYQEFLEAVPLLAGLDRYERMNVADALEPRRFAAGEVVVREGDVEAEHMYIVEAGEAKATKSVDGVVTEVSERIRAGGYFGELALLRSAPRAATVTAVTDLSCLALDRRTLQRILGPLQTILDERRAAYAKYEDYLSAAMARATRWVSAVDGSDAAHTAFKFALALAPATAKMEVLHISDARKLKDGYPERYRPEQIETRYKAELDGRALGADTHTVSVLPLESVVPAKPEAHARQAVVVHCNRTRADYLVVGCVGRKGPKDDMTILGHTADLSLRGAQASLIVVKRGMDELPDSAHFVVCVDGSSCSDRAIAATLPLLRKSDRMTLLTLVDDAMTPAVLAAYDARCGEDDRISFTKLDRIAGQPTGATLADFAYDNESDVTVVGVDGVSAGLAGRRSSTLGSTSDYIVRHLKTPVMVVK